MIIVIMKKYLATLTSQPKIWGIYHHNFFLKTHSHIYIDNLQQHPVVRRGVANQEVKSVQTYLAESSIAARIGETFIDLCAAVEPCKPSLTCAHKCQMEILNIVVYCYVYNSRILKWYRSSYSYSHLTSATIFACVLLALDRLLAAVSPLKAGRAPAGVVTGACVDATGSIHTRL